jgi:glycosyltransferase involved in cell wall biosynthesis
LDTHEQQPSISVVIPTYNGAAFLREAMESVYVQTVRAAEIVVADDRSTDGTAELVEALAAEAPVPVRLIRMPRNTGGPAGPLNAAIEAARGELIAVLEQDDAMRADRLEQQLAALAALPSARFATARACRLGDGDMTCFFWGAADQFGEVVDAAAVAGSPHFLVPGAVAFRALLRRAFVLTNSSYLFHRSLWRDIGGYDRKAKSCSDLAFALGAAARTDVAIVNAPVVLYRLHAASLNHRDPAGASLQGQLVRMAYARRHRHAAPEEWRTIYWGLRMRTLRELWASGRYRAAARLAYELGRCRLGRDGAGVAAAPLAAKT